MDHQENTRQLLLAHCNAYPTLTVQDLGKFLYQSAFGCEHLISDPERVTDYIRTEAASLPVAAEPLTEPLDGGFYRVHLSHLRHGLSADTLGALFCLSAQVPAPGKPALEEKLDIAQAMCREGLLPFPEAELLAFRQAWQAQGYPAIRHSQDFRDAYSPAYRVIAAEFVPFLPLFARLDTMLAKGTVILAIEGGSASGKTTLASLLEKVYGCTVAHMDDFFLRPEQRTPERLSTPGGNVDAERFLEEVLLPLRHGHSAQYRPYDCSTGQLLPAASMEPGKLTVVEGAYSMHPLLQSFYDLSVFLDIDPQLQRERILRRNSPVMARRFFTEWIPLERLYFDATSAPARCGMTISIG